MRTARYRLLDGTDLEVKYDELAPCRICGLPVIAASVGGTDVCPWCDMGVWRNGEKWGLANTIAMIGRRSVFGRRALDAKRRRELAEQHGG